jgi:Flp pilus assembly protein TadB
MSTNENTQHLLTADPTPVELGEELVEVTGAGVRVAEVGLVILLGLLVCPPLLILAVIVAVPAIAFSAVVAAVVAAVVVPTWLVRKVVAHHRAHRTTLFLHRLRPR